MIATSNSAPLKALQDLQAGRQWVCFDEKKAPCNPAGGYVHGDLVSNNPTWGTCQEAYTAWRHNPEKYAGIGREFLREQNITGTDLDHCRDSKTGEIADWAQAVIDQINSYTEISPSGTGVHIWAYGIIPDNIPPCKPKADGYEMYDHARYFTVTGKHLEGTPTTLENRQSELLDLYQEITSRRSQEKRQAEGQKQASTTRTLNSSSTGNSPYGMTALENECRAMSQTGEGGRNDQLNRSAYALGQLVAGGELTQATVEADLWAAAASAGLDDREIEITMRSGLQKGMESPRQAPPSSWQRYEPDADVLHATDSNGHNNGNGHSEENVAGMLASFDADDAGNGDALFYLYGKSFLFCSKVGWFVYKKTHWEVDPDAAAAKRAAVETLRRRRHAAVDLDREKVIGACKCDEKRVNGAVNRLRTLVGVEIEAFDSNPNLLNCQNGVVNLETGELVPHDRSQLFTYCIPINYRPAECPPEWGNFLNATVGGGQEVIDYLQMSAGYSLTGHTREECAYYVVGPPRSGKGTWSEVFMAIMPHPLALSVDFNSFTAKREGDVSNFDLAPLRSSRMIFASESNRGQTLNPAKIKQMTGGDRISCCFKHKDFFSYRPQFKVWMMSNHPVNGDPGDDALWGRIKVIEFPNSYLGIEDKTKKERMKDPQVLEGVLAWAVEGAKRWYALGASGLVTPEAVKLATKAHRDQLDYIQQWLDEETDETDNKEDAWTSNEDVMKSYTRWCDSNNVTPKSARMLSQGLREKGFEVGVQRFRHGRNGRGVAGLFLVNRID